MGRREVFGTASSPEKLERARALGLDHGIDYTTTDVVEEVLRLTDGEGVELAYEHVGGERFAEALGSIGKDGRVVTCGAHAGEVVDFDIIPFFRGQKTVIGSFCYSREEVAACLDLAARGVVEPQVFATFGLAEGRAAYELMEERRHFGKIVVTPSVRRRRGGSGSVTTWPARAAVAAPSIHAVCPPTTTRATPSGWRHGSS